MCHQVLRSLAVPIAFLLSSCSMAVQPEAVTVDSCGAKVDLHRGGTLVVRLAAQITTGYVWRNLPSADAIMVAVGEPEVEPDPRDVDGGWEVQVFRFRADAQGRVTLVFHNQRPWEKNKPPRKTCEIDVTVRE